MIRRNKRLQKEGPAKRGLRSSAGKAVLHEKGSRGAAVRGVSVAEGIHSHPQPEDTEIATLLTSLESNKEKRQAHATSVKSEHLHSRGDPAGCP